MPKLASLAALLVLSMPTVSGCSSADKNPLLGSWKFTSATGTAASCSSSYVFKENVAVISYPGTPADPNNPYSEAIPARVVNLPVVRYMPSPSLVVAMTGGQGFPFDHSNYNFVDRNHMWTESVYGKCYYERTN
jgi:hypothetical protein